MNKDTQFSFLIRDIKRGVITHVVFTGLGVRILRHSCHNDVLFLYLEDGSFTGYRLKISKHEIDNIIMRKNEYEVTVPMGSDLLFYG